MAKERFTNRRYDSQYFFHMVVLLAKQASQYTFKVKMHKISMKYFLIRFTQAGSEVSALLGRIPSAVGYQPTLATDMGSMQERITTTKKGSITSVQVRRPSYKGFTQKLKSLLRPGL